MIELLQHGTLEILGRHPQASNAVFVVECTLADETITALYKPAAGERPLWDFPDVTLAAREVAAYELSEALGMSLVPETVWREDGPAGPGSLQRWIDGARLDDVVVVSEADDGWLPVMEAQLTDGTDVVVAHRDSDALRTMAFFDAVINNADRKAGHLLRDSEARLWGVDHGVTFHADPKLRTVLWGFAEQPIPAGLLAALDVDVRRLPALRRALSEDEFLALEARMRDLASSGRFPVPNADWPAIPWPIY